jgi:hypothetical protein
MGRYILSRSCQLRLNIEAMEIGRTNKAKVMIGTSETEEEGRGISQKYRVEKIPTLGFAGSECME